MQASAEATDITPTTSLHSDTALDTANSDPVEMKEQEPLLCNLWHGASYGNRRSQEITHTHASSICNP